MSALTPQQARQRAGNHIPDKFIDVVNKLIIEKMHIVNRAPLSGVVMQLIRAEVLLKDIVERAASELGVTKEQIYESGWLDFEPLFNRVGWHVIFDKPGYNETYDAHFIFTASISVGEEK